MVGGVSRSVCGVVLLDYPDMQTDAISSVYALKVATSPPVDCWFNSVVRLTFQLVTFRIRFAIPDDWRPGLGPR